MALFHGPSGYCIPYIGPPGGPFPEVWNDPERLRFHRLQPGNDPTYEASARRLGAEIARRGWTLVYGGATVGLMGCVADAALEAGGRVIGVLPRALADLEIAHPGLTELQLVEGMHARKSALAAAADAFIAMPGGLGTLEEIFEAWTWTQLGIHRHPLGFLNVEGYYDGYSRSWTRAWRRAS